MSSLVAIVVNRIAIAMHLVDCIGGWGVGTFCRVKFLSVFLIEAAIVIKTIFGIKR